MKVRVIQATVKDDSDYDFIYDNAVQNTLKDYWTWAETSKGTVCFEKNYEDIGYSLTLCVDAKSLAKYMTAGVFPVPPAVRFPTLMILLGTFLDTKNRKL